MNRRKFFSALPFAAVGGVVGLSNLPAEGQAKKEVMLGPEDFYEIKCGRQNPREFYPDAPNWPECEGTFKILKSQDSASCPRCGYSQDLYNQIFKHIVYK